MEEISKIKAETHKKVAEAEPPFAEKVLSEIQAIKAEVASLKQDGKLSCPQSTEEERKIQGQGRPLRENRRGCKECYKKGIGDQCTHCWKCGESDHFAYNYPQRKGQGQGNCPRLLSRDSQ